MQNYMIFRAAKIARGGALNKTLAHYRNHSKLALERPERSQRNIRKGFSDKEIRQRISEAVNLHNKSSTRALRKDAAVAIEFVFTYSPEMEKQMMLRQPEFVKTAALFVEKELGCPVLRIEKHCDEASDHVHILALAQQNNKINARGILGGPRDMERLQTRVAELFSVFGLQRGISKQITKKRHTSLIEHKKRLQADITDLQKQKSGHQKDLDFIKKNKKIIVDEIRKQASATEGHRVAEEVFREDR